MSNTPFDTRLIDGFLQCPHCTSPDLNDNRKRPDASGISHERYVCQSCHAAFDTVFGVPFFGAYEEADLLGLIEIAANIDNRGKFGVTPATVEHWDGMLEAYHSADDKAQFVASRRDAQSPFLLNRYYEWLEVKTLSAGLDLKGKLVLDLGAGLGFDSHRLTMRGAQVVALECSPILAESGAKEFPQINWYGGFSHALPFRSKTFDAVFCNAALHHMRNISAAMSEAIRVLKVGGTLITTCNSYRPSSHGEERELKTFDASVPVLMGVNERTPPFSEFVDTLKRLSPSLSVDLYTHNLSGEFASSQGKSGTSLNRWDFATDQDALSECGGSLAFKVTVTRDTDIPALNQKASLLSAGTFGGWLHDLKLALSELATFVPVQYVNSPFPGRHQTKFELLNGWRAPTMRSHRTAYRRARWFLSRDSKTNTLSFQIKTRRQPTGKSPTIEILVNGIQTAHFQAIPDRFEKITVNLTGTTPDKPFALEIRIFADDESLELSSFDVKRRTPIRCNTLRNRMVKRCERWFGLKAEQTRHIPR